MAESNGKSVAQVPSGTIPRHVAIIMDGNGRWAKGRGLPRIEGHRAGAKTVRMVVEESRRLGVRYLTLFAFSTENWQRPAAEVSALMQLFGMYLKNEVELLQKHKIRLRVIGDRSRLSDSLQATIEQCESATRENQAMDLILAVSYGGRGEIVQAARQLAEKVKRGDLSPEQITEESLAECLYAPDVCDPDLLIRTSDENRISNFLLWELAYSEIVVSPLLWPEFSSEEYQRCVAEYASRGRRFGLTEEQLTECATDGR